MKAELSNPFAYRVSESRVAEILSVIAEPPGLRRIPKAGDADEDFDFWFDGGACKHHTGSSHFQFKDGTLAIVASPAQWLWVKIMFADGESVEILQKRSLSK